MKTRSKKELLQLVLNNMHLLETGLCKLVNEMLYRKLINVEEYFVLLNQINIHNVPEDSKVLIRVKYV